MQIDNLQVGIPFRACNEDLKAIHNRIANINEQRLAMSLPAVELISVPFKTDEWILIEVIDGNSQ